VKVLLFLILSFLAITAFSKDIVTLEKNNFIVLADEFNADTTNQVKVDLMDILKRQGPFTGILSKPTVYLILYTPGGEINSGLNMFDFILAQNVEVKTVSLFSASMGFQAVQALGERLITDSGVLMAHKARGGFQGEFGDGSSQLDSRYNLWMDRIKRLDELTVKRTKGKHTMESFRKLMENEYWCEGKTCIEQGLADRVVGVRCGLTVQGSSEVQREITYLGMKFNVSYTQPECPVIGIYNIKVLNGTAKVSIFDKSIPEAIRFGLLNVLTPNNREMLKR
jgi:ATP-dependent protease ClpP protease subunit